MANKKISELTAITSIDIADELAIVDDSDNTTKKITLEQIIDFFALQNNNLIRNGSFESWSSGTSSTPDGWTLSGTGASVARSSTKKAGSYATQLTYGSSAVQLSQSYADYVRFQGGTVTVGAWVKCSTASIARIQVGDGVADSYSDYHTGDGTWQFLTATINVNGSASELTMICRVENTGNAIFDSAKLEEGEISTLFFQHPNDEHLKAIDYQDASPANHDYGLLRMECGLANASSGGDVTVTFGTAFTKILGVTGSVINTTGSLRGFQATNLSTTSFDFSSYDSSNTRTTSQVFWIAIGVD